MAFLSSLVLNENYCTLENIFHLFACFIPSWTYDNFIIRFVLVFSSHQLLVHICFYYRTYISLQLHVHDLLLLTYHWTGLIPQITEAECYDCVSDGKFGRNFYPDEMYNNGEDGELTWFNAGVRVGVGIGLGMCLGVGIGVGLLMRSYQATTRNFRRRFF